MRTDQAEIRVQEHPQAGVARRALAEGDRQYEKAARAMQKMRDDGLELREIASQVGGSFGRVSRLLRAFARARTGVPFAEAYADENHPHRGLLIERPMPDPDYDPDQGWDLAGVPKEVRDQWRANIEHNKSLLAEECLHCPQHCGRE